MAFFYIRFAVIIFSVMLAAPACRNSKPVQPDQPDKIVPPSHKPDTSIKVKEDYNALTQSELEKEDQTHMDIAYFPANYANDMAFKRPVTLGIRMMYSRPHKRGRSIIFGAGGVVPYGELWRLGANETPEIELLSNAEIGGKKLPRGRYTMYAIPYQDKWTLIFNSSLFTWGDFNYDSKKDVLRTDVPVRAPRVPLETFLIYFQKTGGGANMIMTWDTVQVILPIRFL
jgi:Protein of unknown function (DUF2911)